MRIKLFQYHYHHNDLNTQGIYLPFEFQIFSSKVSYLSCYCCYFRVVQNYFQNYFLSLLSISFSLVAQHLKIHLKNHYLVFFQIQFLDLQVSLDFIPVILLYYLGLIQVSLTVIIKVTLTFVTILITITVKVLTVSATITEFSILHQKEHCCLHLYLDLNWFHYHLDWKGFSNY